MLGHWSLYAGQGEGKQLVQPGSEHLSMKYSLSTHMIHSACVQMLRQCLNVSQEDGGCSQCLRIFLFPIFLCSSNWKPWAGISCPADHAVWHSSARQAARRWLSTAVSSGSASPARAAFLLDAFNLPSLPKKIIWECGGVQLCNKA